MVDELFVTLAPQLGGGGDAGAASRAMTAGAHAAAGTGVGASLRSARRAAGHLFLRYRLATGEDHHDGGRA
jgi:hypothetical protein